ncbi:translation initiation factor IF-2 [Candidatus Kaiserbacteria bacterium RIFCSPLOWO2_02_FULL_45_11b]|uniref:Translation initiation factor IF-2 n=1 Tax=Candidatus Kaiserbacteria bacterium RIFCSPLOWO2_12_FULL_45_26 TaxID=1798525 RepID=A0A1F6FGA6_9BACT|nr:MAG: translation initiation factor IF-2 [Candidatus Kaiserbacteria bacterium RIFCSPHIGHO2_12_45_16]OGG70923.1 MAG: translation initiation factor IF-2 [Candidatus Kaiserbacteria bacterium RIFCSPLOWO2_01_FULL_45_25]OGG84253.1 MAG: translation initiation factor IF-2 [Candidatus Kaiserbacteria bacterium RIFCSPLOWO2_02_FULL_45_11b]OGG84893.1 MAG: translation initiation factor IF-2 [Candidatus Kaiserbacteria bacterium RIFCSPLOWO2_12_FULL_45_26]
MSKKTQTKENIVKRPPIVVVMGHIDHGKSTLLDYIRKSNSVDSEAGGITQHLSAYVVTHTTKEKAVEQITFLDTPGHEAFQKMRLRGADIADVAILVVSAEDGVKPQTLEALASIKQANIPYIVAINKIDKPGADIMRTQTSLIENEIYVEGMGGDIPWVGISAKTGEGIPDLLDIVVLAADIAELKADTNAPAIGQIIEGKMDPKRGNTATLIVKDGTLKKGSFVVSGHSYTPVRIMEDFNGKPVSEAGPATPVGIAGFGEIPAVGAAFYTVATKKEAEAAIEASRPVLQDQKRVMQTLPIIPILIKADVLGTIEAIEHELSKFSSDRIIVRVIGTGVGDITSNDIQNVSATKEAIVVGFNVKVERQAADLAERLGVEIDTFDIIYELSDWLNTALKNRTPRMEEMKTTGKVKVLKYFSSQKHLHVLGARVEEGHIKMNQRVKITRRDVEIGKGVIKNLQQYKSDVQQVEEGEFGLQLDTKYEVAPGDHLEPYDIVVT